MDNPISPIESQISHAHTDGNSEIFTALQVYGTQEYSRPCHVTETILRKGISMASYLMRTCPRCKYFLGVVVRQSRFGKTVRPIRGVCVRCRYQLSWKLIQGGLLRLSRLEEKPREDAVAPEMLRIIYGPTRK